MARKTAKTLRAQRLRAQAKVRSEQARRAQSMRDYSTGPLPKLTRSALMKLTPSQLSDVAQRVGRMYDAERDIMREEESQQYHIAPHVTVTKKDRMFAARPDVTDAQIQAAPSKRRRYLRRQQRKINEAKSKIKRAQEYARLDSMGYTLGQLRDLEQSGESPLDVIGGMSLHITPREHFMRTRKNPLTNQSFINAATRTDRRTLVQNIQLYAKMAGLKVPENIGKNVGRFSDDTDAMTDVTRWSDRLSGRIGSFSADMQKRFDALSPSQKKWLINNTSFSALVEQSTYYDDEKKKFQTMGAGVTARAKIEDYMRQAATR